ncbi:hypothetical protein FACS1894105_13110 [Clostridia bacterium]|nr:hypothetical protein FACS1894105_13110 [Clostridia bacterium]
MKTAFLKELNLEAETIEKIMAENGKDIASAKKESDTITAERDTLKAQLDDTTAKLKAFDGKDFDALDAQLKKLTGELDSTKSAHEKELLKLKRDADTKEFLSAHKFRNDFTREALEAKINAAIDDPANAGKSRADLLNSYVNGEDGKPKPGIFEETTPPNPNVPNIAPPAGDISKPPPKETPKII